MTMVLFFPEQDQVLLFETSAEAGELVAAVWAGRWAPPDPYGKPSQLQPGQFTAAQAGGLVIIRRARPWPEERPPIEVRLTPRQLEALQALAAGWTIKELSARWKVHPRTISYHVQQIKSRLAVDSLSEAIRRAVELGLEVHENRPP